VSVRYARSSTASSRAQPREAARGARDGDLNGRPGTVPCEIDEGLQADDGSDVEVSWPAVDVAWHLVGLMTLERFLSFLGTTASA
jgi:hypothetical protein